MWEYVMVYERIDEYDWVTECFFRAGRLCECQLGMWEYLKYVRVCKEIWDYAWVCDRMSREWEYLKVCERT